MPTVEVFDPPMCCSTGVCGPSVDPALAEFAVDLGWLVDQGASVGRHNLSQEPASFAQSELVRELLAERGEKALPAVVVGGELRSSGRYPTRDELAVWALGGAAPQPLDPATAELVAIGAAVGASCEPCFEVHLGEARRLGVSRDAVAASVRVAQAVKDAPARSMRDLVARLLGTDPLGETAGANADPSPAGREVSALASEQSVADCCGGQAAASDAAQREASSEADRCCAGTSTSAAVEMHLSQSTGRDSCCG